MLDEILREQPEQYDGLVRSLVAKRLERVGFAAAAQNKIDPYFEELDTRDYWRSVDKLLPTPKENQLAPYHRKLAADLKTTLGLDEPTITSIIDVLQVPQHRFLEKAAVFQFRKLWPANRVDALSLAVNVGDQARALERGDRDAGADLAGLISHFSSDILAQLFHDFARRLPYASFKTMVQLSQGNHPQPAGQFEAHLQAQPLRRRTALLERRDFDQSSVRWRSRRRVLVLGGRPATERRASGP